MGKHEELTQKYSTWGDKLLQHADVLHSIQHHKEFKPITIQLAPTEVCDSDCPFCSVAGRPLKSSMKFDKLEQCLRDFRTLGAKSVEITGGGNPLLYRDKEAGKNINDVIRLAADLGYDIGIITNSHNLKQLDPVLFDKISWIRVSLIQLDEGKNPEDYNFCGFPESKLGLSYIIYETGGVVDALSRTKRAYQGTTAETIHRIARVVELNPGVKFVRIAGNCLIKGNNANVRSEYKEIIDAIDTHQKFFIKDIGYDDSPFDDGCYVGLIRPYVAAHPQGNGEYYVYICTSHVLNTRVYDLDYALCEVRDILKTWAECNERYKMFGYPYEIKCNGGSDWCSSCNFCYYKFNNKLLHTVAQEMPDKNFP
jgi:hypothetical protein